MPRVKTQPSNPSREKGERNLDLPLYLNRILPIWSNPTLFDGNTWRAIVQKQPIAVNCRDTLISNYLALDWKIEPRDSTKRDELKEDIKYYEKLLNRPGDYDYDDLVKWAGEDYFDIPFGFAAETVRENDSPEGKVTFIEPLDGATLFPYPDADYPVAQMVRELGIKTIFFPAHAIDRMYYSPRREILRKGWGFAPPERIYLALELINRGDVYYANLLLDTPQVGILDLGDMEKTSAEEWVKSWRDMLFGIDPFKIPVLYQHTTKAEFIPFTKSPVELMFDKASAKYASIVAAGYGMSLSDISLGGSSAGGGDTLAGSIREERHTRKTGFARLKKAYQKFFDRILPDTLQYKLIDLDDEFSVALGRARLATMTAFGMAIDKRVLTPTETRAQLIADGLISVSIPEEVPEEAKKEFDDLNPIKSQERPGSLGKPINPSQGGYGEVRSEVVEHAYQNDTVFRSMYDTLEGNWDSISEQSRFIMLSGLQSYLQEYQEKNNLLDEFDINETKIDYNKEELEDVTEIQTT